MDPLRNLLRSRFHRTIRAPYPILELGIQAGENLAWDPRLPDLIVHVRFLPREFLETALEARDRKLRRRFTEAARIFGDGEKAPGGSRGKSREKPTLRLVR